MQSCKSILIFIILFCLNNKYLIAQGELLSKGQSGGSFIYSTAPVDNDRIHALSYTYTYKRAFEIGTSGYTNPNPLRIGSKNVENDVGFSLLTSGYVNTNGLINLKGTVGLSYAGFGLGYLFGATVFANNSIGNSRIVPSFSILSQYGSIGYGGGLNFKLGSDLSLIGGINLLKHGDSGLALGLNIGFLLSKMSPKLEK